MCRIRLTGLFAGKKESGMHAMNNEKQYGGMLPILIDLSGRKVMVIGSGRAAGSLVCYLSHYTEDLTLLSSSPSEELKAMCAENDVRVLEKAYTREDLYGMDYVFCVSSSGQIRKDAAALCRTMGIRIYMQGDPGRSDFILEKGICE